MHSGLRKNEHRIFRMQAWAALLCALLLCLTAPLGALAATISELNPPIMDTYTDSGFTAGQFQNSAPQGTGNTEPANPLNAPGNNWNNAYMSDVPGVANAPAGSYNYWNSNGSGYNYWNNPWFSQGYSNGYGSGYYTGDLYGYGQGYNYGYGTGYNDGNAYGYGQGYNYGYGTGYDSGYGSGFSTGNVNGYGQGYNNGFGSGYGSAYDQGYSTGNTNGYGNGFSSGYGTGYNDGNTNGYGQGYTNGYNQGYGTGFDAGYGSGYNGGYGTGYQSGYTSGYNLSIGPDYIGAAIVDVNRDAITKLRGCKLRSTISLSGSANILRSVHGHVHVFVLQYTFDMYGRKWYRIRLDDGLEGWAAASLISLK